MKIMKGIDEFHRKTCIKFIEKSPSDEDYIHFTNDEDGGCSAHVGRRGGKQEVGLFTHQSAYHCHFHRAEKSINLNSPCARHGSIVGN